MYNFILMTFDNRQDVEPLHEILRRLHETTPNAFDATFVSKDQQGVLQITPLRASDRPLVPSARLRTQIAPDKEFARKVLNSLGPESTLLFLAMGEDETCNGLLTTLLTSTPRAVSAIKPEGKMEGERRERRLVSQLKSYQAAVDGLETLGADASEFELKQAFDVVDEAYNHLVGCLAAGAVDPQPSPMG